MMIIQKQKSFSNNRRSTMTNRLAVMWCICCIGLLSLPCCMPMYEQHREILDDCTCNYDSSPATLSVQCINVSFESYQTCFHTYQNAKHLVFRNSGLTRVPEGLNILKSLVHVDFSYNSLTEVDFQSAEEVCKQISWLVLDFNNIRTLRNGSLDCFTSLQQISLRNNSLHTIENGTFKKYILKNLREVTLIYNELTEFDFSLINVEPNTLRVNLSWNAISRFTNSVNFTIYDINPGKGYFISFLHNNISSFNISDVLKLLSVTNNTELYRLWNCGFDFRFNPFVCDCNMYPLGKLLRDVLHMDPDNPLFGVTCDTPDEHQGRLIGKVPDNSFNCSVHTNCPNGCECIHTIALNLTVIKCNKEYSVNFLPVQIPKSKTLELYLHSNRLTELSSRYYLDASMKVLDVSGSGVLQIEEGLIPQLANIKIIGLHNNLISKLPRSIEHLRTDNIQSLTLYGNPFLCDCHSLWLKHWILSRNVSKILLNADKIICVSGIPSGKVLRDVPDSQFQCVFHLTPYEILIIVGSSLILLIIAVKIIWHKRLLLVSFFFRKLNLYKRRKQPKTSCQNNMLISHSSADDTIVLPIIRDLRAVDPPYNVYSDENYTAGDTIANNICNAIESSGITIFFLSNRYLRSHWCMEEFRRSHYRFFGEGDVQLVVVLLEDLDQNLLDDELKVYIRTHNVIHWKIEGAWDRLLNALPERTNLLAEETEWSPL